MSTHTCSVCGTSSFKYHCPSCRAKSCSLQCYKTHKGLCARLHEDDQPTPSTESLTTTAEEKTNSLPTPETLTRDPRLQELFQQHPMLRPKLKSIFEAALANVPDNSSPAHNARTYRSPKSPEQRLNAALRRLQHDMNSENAERIGLMAFADLVRQLGSPQAQEEG